MQAQGWTGVKNGELLQLAESEFDLFITADPERSLPAKTRLTQHRDPGTLDKRYWSHQGERFPNPSYGGRNSTRRVQAFGYCLIRREAENYGKVESLLFVRQT